MLLLLLYAYIEFVTNIDITYIQSLGHKSYVYLLLVTLPRLIDVQCRVDSASESSSLDVLPSTQTNCILQLKVLINLVYFTVRSNCMPVFYLNNVYSTVEFIQKS